ncbi:MAG: prepilin-type N-terminal cleavage/methylation domain-containing protein [Opitutaceae bacterium]|nr:prepilin-type N-terminal cleavage/methylation domain-containing protein [Verrucomicrobiales bacterium]
MKPSPACTDQSFRKDRRHCSLHSWAFTLTELLVVIAVIAILAALLLPSLSRSKSQALGVSCLNTLKQLQTCFAMYVHDNNDTLPPNNFVYNVNSGQPITKSRSWCPGNTRIDNTTTNIERGLLFPYNRSVAIYRCPADLSTIETPEGVKLSQVRTRSYNMSQSVNGEPDPGLLGVLSYQKYSEIIDPPPSRLMVFIEVHDGGILDSLFGIPPTNSFYNGYWFDLPSGRHNQGGTLSFADGHAERWKWAAPKTFVQLLQKVTPEEMPDYERVQNHTLQKAD